MPLTKSGRKVLKGFIKEYGKVKGKRIFYSYMNKHPIKTKSWHRKRK